MKESRRAALATVALSPPLLLKSLHEFPGLLWPGPPCLVHLHLSQGTFSISIRGSCSDLGSPATCWCPSSGLGSRSRLFSFDTLSVGDLIQFHGFQYHTTFPHQNSPLLSRPASLTACLASLLERPVATWTPNTPKTGLLVFPPTRPPCQASM